MSTSIEVDDVLIRDAVERSGLPGGREAVEEALRVFIRLHAQRAAADLFGKLPLESDSDGTQQGRAR